MYERTNAKISVKQKPLNKFLSERRFRGTIIQGIMYHVIMCWS